jgi:hypothetical protein
MVYPGAHSFLLLKACRCEPFLWPGRRCAGPAGLTLKLAGLAHQDYWLLTGLATSGAVYTGIFSMA